MVRAFGHRIAHSMTGNSSRQFGLIIAYVLPGFIALVGLSPVFPGVAQWLRPVSAGQFDFGLGPPLYAILAAMALGLVLDSFRWISIDQVHHWMGVRRPTWEDGQLERVLGAFDYLVQNHYRFYAFNANTLIAVLTTYGLNRVLGTLPLLGPSTDVATVLLLVVLFLASRSALANYFARTSRLIGLTATDLEATNMYNGNDHGGSGGQPKPTESKPQQEPKATPETPKPPQPGSGK
jgi:hypothetical protein